MIVQQGEKVRALYWQAIHEMSSEKVPSGCKLSASADFLRRIIFRSVRLGSFELIGKWWGIVAAAHENKKIKLIQLTLQRVLSAAVIEVLSSLAARLGGTKLRVIYWR